MINTCDSLAQWISGVLGYSSQRGSSASEIVGPADVFPSYGDNNNTWAPQFTRYFEYIELAITVPVHIKQVEIFGKEIDDFVLFLQKPLLKVQL